MINYNIINNFSIIEILAILFTITSLGLVITDNYSNNTWFCNSMGWHKKPKKIGFDGASLQGVCPRCGKHVLQDSQGNWF